MLICRACPPTIIAWPTPGSDSNCRRRTLSQYSVKSRVEVGAETAMVITGVESGSNFSTVGCSIPLGRFGRARFTLSRTSWAATSASFSRTKLTKTCEMPCDEIDRNSSMPLIVFTASSILSVISVSTSSEAEPVSRVVTVMRGKSIFG